MVSGKPSRTPWLERVGLVVVCLTLGCGAGERQPTEPPPARASAAAHCGDLPGAIEQIECYVDRATLVGHPKPCQEAAADGVRYQCYAVLAARLKDASLCDDIPTSSDEARQLRDACLSDVAEVLSEAALCTRISTTGLRDSCFFKIAGATGDTTLCERIGDPGLKSGCTGEPVIVD
jgi:hypothetical protein